jgi:hypothetical protein
MTFLLEEGNLSLSEPLSLSLANLATPTFFSSLGVISDVNLHSLTINLREIPIFTTAGQK